MAQLFLHEASTRCRRSLTCQHRLSRCCSRWAPTRTAAGWRSGDSQRNADITKSGGWSWHGARQVYKYGLSFLGSLIKNKSADKKVHLSCPFVIGLVCGPKYARHRLTVINLFYVLGLRSWFSDKVTSLKIIVSFTEFQLSELAFINT